MTDSSEKKNNRLLTGIIISISVIGIIYFGYRVLSENKEIRENPFEYDIESFKKADPDLLHYSEVPTVKKSCR